MSFVPFFLSADAPAGADALGMWSGLGTFVPILFIILIMYVFMIRPQTKKQKETEKMLAALKKGDKVVTIGGIHGTVSSVKESTIIVKVDDGTKIEFNRSAIASVTVDKPAEAAPAEKKGLFGKKATEAARETKEAAASYTGDPFADIEKAGAKK